MSKKNTETVKVTVRTRPMNSKEIERGCTEIVKTDVELCSVTLSKPDEEESKRTMTFDCVYGGDSLQ